ncbi:MAG TPA: hypothetical protein PL009_05080 [Flavipsychrobacter sp.]|nr:hypothetical protein [Flavipsychrobacter sp.]
MAFEIAIQPIALIDVDETVSRYESELKGLGNKFLQSLSSTLEKIKTNPYLYTSITNEVRRALVKNFPYKVLFTIEAETVIVAVVHFGRSKRYLSRRMK